MVAAFVGGVLNVGMGFMRASFLSLGLALLATSAVSAQPRGPEARRPRPGVEGRPGNAEASFDFGPWYRFRYGPADDRGSFRSAYSQIACGSCSQGRCNDREWNFYQRCQERARELEKRENEWRRDAEKRRDEFERDMAKREREFRKREEERYRKHEREVAERWRELERRR
jgi:hypothetical protein